MNDSNIVITADSTCDLPQELIDKYDTNKDGEIDYDKVSNIIIKDLREGKLGKVTFDEV